MLNTVDGDVTEARERVICHQTNCTVSGRRGKGVAGALFSKYPYADTYQSRRRPAEPGTNVYNYNLSDPSKPVIVNMNAQFNPGRDDSQTKRLKWFRMCLDNLGEWCKQRNVNRIAMPHGIGCGLAGGSPSRYNAMLAQFCETHDVNITLYRLQQ